MKYNILRGPQVKDAKTPLLNNLHWQLKAINHVRILILQLPFYINYNLTKKKNIQKQFDTKNSLHNVIYIYILFFHFLFFLIPSKMTVVATNMKMCLSVKNNVIDKFI